MLPGRTVVSGPCSRIPVPAEEVGAGEDERSGFRACGKYSFARGSYHKHPVDIVVLEMSAFGKTVSASVDVVLRHCLVRRVIDLRLVDIIPDSVYACGYEILVKSCPPLLCFGTCEIREGSGTRPCVSMEFLSVGYFYYPAVRLVPSGTSSEAPALPLSR